MAYPSDFRYSKDHEWIQLDGNSAKIGITDYAQHSLGDVVFVELPKAGAKFAAGAPFGTVESVKAVSEVYSPVACEVIAVNESLAKSPETINTDPHGAAWLIKVRVANPADASALMTAAAYEAYISEKQKDAQG